jgi:probable phosphoglycerate mutase
MPSSRPSNRTERAGAPRAARSIAAGRAAARAAAAIRPTVVLLVRHGRTPTTGRVLPGRAPGLHLSAEGRGQAERVAARLAELATPPTALYTSPLERARETAVPAARALGLRARIDRGLVECDVGAWTGISLRRVVKRPEWSHVQRWPSGFRFPDGESFTEMWERANDAVLRLARAHPGETVVAVSHADPIKAVVAAASGAPLDLFQRFVISPCSISAVLFGAGGPQVLCANATGSLRELVPS